MQSTVYSSHILAIPWIFWPISNITDPWPLQNIILKFRVIINSITLGTQMRYSAYTSTHCNYSAMIYPHNNVTLIKQLLNFNLSYKVLFCWGQTDTQNSFHKTLGITLMPNLIKIHSTYAVVYKNVKRLRSDTDRSSSAVITWPLRKLKFLIPLVAGRDCLGFPAVCTIHLMILWSVLLTQYCAGDKIEKNEMGWACGAYGWGEGGV